MSKKSPWLKCLELVTHSVEPIADLVITHGRTHLSADNGSAAVDTADAGANAVATTASVDRSRAGNSVDGALVADRGECQPVYSCS